MKYIALLSLALLGCASPKNPETKLYEPKVVTVVDGCPVYQIHTGAAIVFMSKCINIGVH